MNKISAVYKITNTITGDFYIGSSKNVKQRWARHKCKSTWNEYPNSQLYKDMQKYGTDKFIFEVLEEVEAYKLKETEQKFIETLKPTYNICNAKGLNIERRKEYQKDYKKSDKYKEYKNTDKYKKSQKKYWKSDKGKESLKKYHKKYNKTDKGKETLKKAKKKYYNQLCYYNGETLTLAALASRFRRAGIDHYTQEAKKYLVH